MNLKQDERHKERKALGACMLAWGTASFEFNLFLIVAASVSTSLDLGRPEMSAVLTAALFSSALGGWLAGRFADRLGRIRLFQWSIVGLGISALLTSISFDFTSLLIARIVMGVAFGAEWTAGTVLLNECVRPEKRGRCVGVLLSAWGIGWGLAAVVNAIAHLLFDADFAWKFAVAIGVIPAFFAWSARRLVSETDVFLSATQKPGSSARPSLWSGPYLKRTLLLCFLAVGVQGGFYALNIWMPTYLRGLGVSPVNTSILIGFAVVGSILGSIMGGWVSDFLGRRLTLALGSFGLFATATVLVSVEPFSGLLEVSLFASAFLASVTFSSLAPTLSENYPTEVRAEGQGFSYNSGRAIAAVFPLLIGLLSSTFGIGNAMISFVGVSFVIVVTASILISETKGSDLSTVN